MAKQFKNHQEVSKDLKWNLNFLLDGKSPENKLEEILKIFKKQLDFKHKKYESPENYLKFLAWEEKNYPEINKFNNYISNATSINVIDPKIKELQAKYSYELYKFSNLLGDEKSLFFDHANEIKKWINRKDFAPYKHFLESELSFKNHRLPKNIATFRIKESRGFINTYEPFSILTNSELVFKDIFSSKKRRVKVTMANLATLLKSNDAKIRKDARISYINAYWQHRNTLANFLYQHKKKESSEAMIKKFDSAVNYLTFDDKVDKKFLNVLYSSVQKNVSIFKKYHKYNKIFYKKKYHENMTKYDVNRDLISLSSTTTPHQAKQDIINGLKPFGKEYLDVVKKAFKENWVDMMPVKNKRSGAYSIGSTYGVDKKLILMNFDSTIDSTLTLVHEMGHSMHSYFADKNQNYHNSSYPIFLAEVASIFNELILLDYFFKNSKNNLKLQFKFKKDIIRSFINTVLRQVEWSNYEYDVYEKIDQGQPINTFEALAEIYYENSKKYSNRKKWSKLGNRNIKNQISSIHVPHFYYGFYVYKYALGQLAAIIFFQKYKKEGPKALQTFIDKFLSKGGHGDPLVILKNAGIDFMDPQTYQQGFDFIDQIIKEYIQLGKKIFKV